jgi:hypothetical protein
LTFELGLRAQDDSEQPLGLALIPRQALGVFAGWRDRLRGRRRGTRRRRRFLCHTIGDQLGENHDDSDQRYQHQTEQTDAEPAKAFAAAP